MGKRLTIKQLKKKRRYHSQKAEKYDDKIIKLEEKKKLIGFRY